jgi:hypothetical protein
MALHHFQYQLHDDAQHDERIAQINAQTGLNITEDHPLWDLIGRPFHTVTLDCMLDDQIGEVRIVGASK